MSTIANQQLRVIWTNLVALHRYDYEYTNSSHPGSTSNEATYVIPSSSSSSYMQPASGHSSAYSALSASLASLKSRLNARSINLAGSGDSQATSLFSNGDSQQAQAGSQQSSGSSQSSGPTYLSVSNPHEHQSAAAGYSVGSASQHGNGNKTIVLAIPAKINFLTDGRASASSSKQSSDSQHSPQLAVIQPSGEQQPRGEYTKQLGEPSTLAYDDESVSRHDANSVQTVPIGGQEGLMDQTGAIIARDANADSEQQQYVLINSPTSVGEHQTQLVQPAQPMYSSIYSAIQPGLTALQPIGSYAMKYLPTYQTASVQNPTIQKIYAHTEPDSAYEQQSSPMGRYGTGCLDTCNSADIRWRKHSVSKYKYCCSRSSQYDATFDQSGGEKSGELGSSKQLDDAYYSYLYRRSKSRRTRRGQRVNRYRYSAPTPSSYAGDEEGGSQAGESSEATRPNSARSYYNQESSTGSSRYHRSRSHGPGSPMSAPAGLPSSVADQSEAIHEPSAGSQHSPKIRYSPKGSSFRRGRSRDLDSQPESSTGSSEQTEEDGREGAPGYGHNDFSVDSTGRYAMEPRGPAIGAADDEESRANFDDVADLEQQAKSGAMAAENQEYPNENMGPEGQLEDAEYQPTEPRNNAKRRKNQKNSRPRKGSVSKETGSKSGRKARRSKQTKLQNEYASSQSNATDFDSTQVSDQHHQDHSLSPSLGSSSSQQGDEDQQHMGKDSANTSHETSENTDKEPISVQNKYKGNLNDSAVVSLSRTTMHLKEILSILERKAQLKLNETSNGSQTTSTPSPVTTTNVYSSLPSLFSSQYNSPSLSSALSGDYLMSDLNLKSPYKFDSTSLASFSSPSISLPSSYSSLTSDPYSPLSSFASSQYGLGPTKHLSTTHPRKKRVSKNIRYNSLMLPKTQGLSGASSLLSAANKSPFLNPTYYPSLQYPYWYSRANSASVTNSYPYKSLSKSPYSTTFGSSLSSKLTSGGIYGDDYRLSGLSSFDPIATVASSLRPTASMRLRAKPFVFQPQIAPIYTRHSILTQNPDLKK